MNKVVLVGALAAGGLYTLHNAHKDAAVDADTNKRKEDREERYEEYAKRMSKLGGKNNSRRKAQHLNYAANYVIAMRLLLNTLRLKLGQQASSSSLLQLPCISTGKFSSVSTGVLAYAILWGQSAPLHLIEDG